MKKVFLALALLYCMSTMAVLPFNMPRLHFSMGIYDPTEIGNPYPRTPICPPNVGINNHTLYFETGHAAFTLVLLDEDGEEAYEVSVPSTVDVLVLPSTLVGNYELQLYDGSEYYFYCDIVL